MYHPLDPSVPVTTLVMTGGVVSADVTFTLKVAGGKLNVPPVLFEVWATLMVVVPTPTGVTVSVGVEPQPVNVTWDGETVATEVELELTATTRVVEPVKLQFFLPSSSVLLTYNVVVAGAPGKTSAIDSAAASIVASRLLEMSSAYVNSVGAAIPTTSTTVMQKILVRIM